MAETEAEVLPNGNTGLPEEDERLKQRPADIDADVREMERRKRVEALMSSKLFREELERVLDQQMHEGSDAPLLQRIREMVGGRLHTGSLRGPACVLPINDIRGIEGVGYEKGEKILRCKLAAVYRLVDLFGWTQTGISGQITARLNTAVEQVLTTPRGLLPHEVTASSLVKVDMQGVVQDQGTTNFPVNVEGFSLHASVHAARPDVRCVLHVRSPAALAVSSMKRGLLPLCHEAALLGDIAYHRVPHGILDNEECDKLVRALGPSAKVLMLSSGGALCCGGTLEEAFHQARNLTAACDVQLRLASLPLDELQILDDETRTQIYAQSRKPPSDAGKWRVGGEEFEALMRMLDNAGFRTGYIYRHPLVKNDVPKPKNDVEVPPAVSSLGYLLEEEELYKQGLWKKGQGTKGERTRWLNSPNVYQKVEVLETGTTDPKKITKWVDANTEEWVQDGSPAHSSTPVKIDTLQFVPKNTNPKEFKALQQQIKENRRADKISAGPQSHILEGVTWDEASKLVGEDAVNTHTGDHVVLMGAASKGIIQRGYQHNATMYSAPYARNPFDHVTDTDIAEYRRTVERKQRGNEYDTDLSESEAASAAQVTSAASAPSETEEESRDEHRVLRIETKQAPVRSQPEVVLSDDSVDFLNAERSHADRTKGKAENRSLDEALSSNKRSKHEYSRNTNFDHVLKKYQSPDKEPKQHPKCKVSLHQRLKVDDFTKVKTLDLQNVGNASSRSSLYSIPSIEWDGRCKSEYALKTRSLPRQRVSNFNKLYRTRSHSGFINNYVKNPEPTHYHLPRCRSCGANNVSYAWELNKPKKKTNSIFMSIDNIPQGCLDEDENLNFVKVEEKVVPVYEVAEVETEFVESQEFTEDNYLGEIGNSFSSENQTVIETKINGAEHIVIAKDETDVAEVHDNNDVYRAEVVQVEERTETEDINNNTVESVEGEYHSFTDELDFEEAVYESPVKELVEKDIRDYSVPINFYCEDYAKSDSPKKSPLKRRELPKGAGLEPILEESKSSYDDSNNSTEISKDKVICNNNDTIKDEVQTSDTNNQTTKEEIQDLDSEISNIVGNIFDTAISAIELKSEIGSISEVKITTELLETEYVKHEYFINDEESDITTELDSISTNVVQTAIDVYIENDLLVEPLEEVLDSVYDDVFEILSNEAASTTTVKCNSYAADDKEVRASLYSVSSGNDLPSFNSTVEFEKYEAISELIASILDKIDFDAAKYENFFDNVENRVVDTNFEINFGELGKNVEITERSSDLKTEASTPELFSIQKIIDEIETKEMFYLNDTVSTENSESELTQSSKIVEAIVYYLFDMAFFTCTKKNRINKHIKKVITVVDSEDILFTATPLWTEEVEQEFSNYFEEANMDIPIAINDSALNNIETFLSDENIPIEKEQSQLKGTVENTILNEQEIEVDLNVTQTPITDADNIEVCENINKTYVFHDEEEIGNIIYNLESLDHANESNLDAVGNVSEIHDVTNNLECEKPCEHCVAEEAKRSADIENFLNETFVLDPKTDMNTAFVEETELYSVSYSSPRRDSINEVFETCSASPIKNDNSKFAGDDLSVLYEKDVTILGSPFVKKAAVISMSQTEHSGGIKYWLSFDESFSEDKNVTRKVRKYNEDQLPSFVAVDFENEDTFDEHFEGFKRSSVLLDKNENFNESFASACASRVSEHSHTDYNTCDSMVDSKISDIESDHKRLLYDSRIDLKRSPRKYSSWPPVGDSLFYRIISKFRMSESFDPSDLEASKFESSF